MFLIPTLFTIQIVCVGALHCTCSLVFLDRSYFNYHHHLAFSTDLYFRVILLHFGIHAYEPFVGLVLLYSPAGVERLYGLNCSIV